MVHQRADGIFGHDSIGRITTSGAVTNYTDRFIDEPEASPRAPTGPCGSPTAVATRSGGSPPPGSSPTTRTASINGPSKIVAGPDGALWFTNAARGSGGSIGRITTAGVVTSYTNSSVDQPHGITVGSDGALWFTNHGSNSIGRITTAGVITSYSGPSIHAPQGITAGPDGALWFTNQQTETIGRITTTGVISKFTGMTASGAISAGADGALWFADGPHTIGRMTVHGMVTTTTDTAIA